MNPFNFKQKRTHRTTSSDANTLVRLNIVKGGKLKDLTQTYHLRVSFTPLAQTTLGLEPGNKLTIGFDKEDRFAIVRSDEGYMLTNVGDKLSFSFRVDPTKYDLKFDKSYSKDDLKEEGKYLIGHLFNDVQKKFDFS